MLVLAINNNYYNVRKSYREAIREAVSRIYIYIFIYYLYLSLNNTYYITHPPSGNILLVPDVNMVWMCCSPYHPYRSNLVSAAMCCSPYHPFGVSCHVLCVNPMHQCVLIGSF
eukprot:GHVR01102686.1.p1 GENE.GHVR01102686.1~~GHVR01102686.1.p1  ORF type:complete len:113 (-),score=10.01 GHVR01102686.1:122-460(-)